MEKHHEEFKHRVITLLDREEMDFLDKLGKDALFSGGHKLTYNDILKGLIDFAIEMGISKEKVDSMDTFKQKMFEHMCKEMKKEASNEKTTP